MRTLILLCFLSVCASAADDAKAILTKHGIDGGVVVHLGLGDQALTAGLAPDARYILQGLDPEPARVEATRDALAKGPSYGRMSASLLVGTSLPFTDNLVRLLVVSRDCGVAEAEMLRVVSPGGTLLRLDTGGKAIVKSRDGLDDWPHYLYDATGNAVGKDTVVAPPRYFQWVDHPLAYRSHSWNQSFMNLISAAGRVLYIQDLGPVGVLDHRFPETWAIICRDAFSGQTLWQVPMGSWGWREWEETGPNPGQKIGGNVRGLWGTPTNLNRRMITDGKEVFVTRDYRGHISVLDLFTGKVVREFPDLREVDEILMPEPGLLVVSARTIPKRATEEGIGKSEAFVEAFAQEQETAAIVALDATTGKVRWRTAVSKLAPGTLAVSQGRVSALDYENVFCLDLATGKELWRQPYTNAFPKIPNMPYRRGGGVLAMWQDLVMVAGKGFTCYEATTGKVLWTNARASSAQMFGEYYGFFVAKGLVWLKPSEGLNPRTGEPQAQNDLGGMFKRGHHSRCYRYKATERYLIQGMRGAEFVDLEGDNDAAPDWIRSGCGVGVLPANGLLYATPDPCQCYKGVKLQGFKVLSGHRGPVTDPGERMERGTGDKPKLPAADPANDWPMHRHDPARSASITAAVPASPTILWSTPLGNRATAPTVVGQHLFTAIPDSHQVVCLDAAEGTVLWRHIAGGRVNMSPTYVDGRLYFGGMDGTVTCLDAATGTLVWRFLAAPERRQMMAFGGLESVWPVFGSLIVDQGLVYASTGRHTHVDGGIILYALDAATGAVRHQTRLTIDPPPPSDLYKPIAEEYKSGIVLDGSLNDALVLADDRLSLFFQLFDRELKQIPTPKPGGNGQRDLGTPRITATGGFTDAAHFDREFWSYSRYWWYPQWAKIGSVLCFDQAEVFTGVLFNTGSAFNHKIYRWNQGGSPSILKAASMEDAEDPMKLKYPTTESKPRFQTEVPVVARALVKAADQLLVAGPPSDFVEADPLRPYEERGPGRLVVSQASDGKIVSSVDLPAVPLFEGLSAARGRIFIALADGSLVCLGSP